jgi:hypothetical protein
MKMAVLWDIAPCSLVDTDRRFRGVYCFLRPDDGLMWEMMPLPLVIITVAITQFSEKVDLCGFKNDLFN